jgi:hydroxylaminobenzene mutase
MPLLSSLGLISLALAGLSGWLVLATMQRPRWFADHGVVAPMRFRQLHLDWVSMGLILIAIDQVVPDRPAWITALLVVGLVVNPLLFVPLAWGHQQSEKLPYRVVTTVSFTAASGGLTALALHALI